MKLWVLRAIVVVMLVVAVGSAAFAQYESSNKSRLGVRMMCYRPSQSTLRDLNGCWLVPSVDIHLTFDKYDRPNSMLSVGWFGQDGKQDGWDINAKMVPITATYIKRFGNENGSKWYAGGGVGVYVMSYREATSYYTSIKDSGKQLGLSFVGGLEFAGGAWFAEMRYDKIGKLNRKDFNDSIDFSGWSVSLGSRLAY